MRTVCHNNLIEAECWDAAAGNITSRRQRGCANRITYKERGS